MACAILVDWSKTTGFTLQGVLTEIYVQGTAQGCTAVKVTLTCENIALPSATVQVGATGTWFHSFSQFPTACRCNGKVKIQAESADENEVCINPDHDDPHDLACMAKIPPQGMCPGETWVLGPFGPCDAAGDRQVTVAVSLSGQVAVDVELRDAGTNTLLASQQGNTPLTLTHTGTYASGTSHDFKLIYNKPLGCNPSNPSVHTVKIPLCKDDIKPPAGVVVKLGDLPVVAPGPIKKIEPEPKTHPPPYEPKPDSNVCGSMVWIVGAALSLAAAAVAVTLAVNLCVPGAAAISWWWAIGPAIGAAVLVALWYVLCTFVPDCECPTGCDWAQIGTMTAFASTAVVGWLSGCCPVLAWVSGAFLAAYVAALAAWLKACNPGACKALKANLVALVSGAIPAITYIALVPTLAACGSTIVAAAAATVAGILAIAAAAKCPNS